MEKNNQNQFEIDGNMVSLDDLIKSYNESKTQNNAEKKAVTKREQTKR
jgi:hypothetical protein